MHTSHYYDYYAQQAGQTGHGQYFIGPQFQRGAGIGGIFRSLFNFVRPLFKPAVKYVGKTMLKTGSNILSDMSSGRNFKESAKEHFKEAGEHLIDKAVKKMRGGKALKRKRMTKKAHSQLKRLKRQSPDELD